MRGRLKAGTMLAALLTTLTVAGCAPSLPAEVDEKLADDWKPMAAVTGWEPKVGECNPGQPSGLLMRTTPLVDCAKTHYGEIVHVGAFTTDKYPGPADRAKALAECDVKAVAYLGRAWGDAPRLEMRVALPKSDTWASGARWFSCEVVETATADDEETYVNRTGSLKGAVPAALLAGCVVVHRKGDDITKMQDVPCATAHQAEYVGVYRASASTAYPESERQWTVVHKGCDAVLAKFLGVPVSEARYYGGITSPRRKSAWAEGDHAVRCAISFGTKTMKKSVRGSKGKGIPS